MKKTIIGIILVMAVSLSTIYAKPLEELLPVYYEDIIISLFGEKFTPKNTDDEVIEPFIHNGSIYVPVRAFAEALGKKVKWDEQSKTVMIDDTFSEREVFQAEQTLKEFFSLFSAGQNDRMKELVSGNLRLYDFSEYVYGMKSTSLSSVEYLEEYSDCHDNTLVFFCTFADVVFASHSTHTMDDSLFSCYVIVKKEADQYKICDIVSGL